MADPNAPINFADALGWIAQARRLDPPNDAEVVEMRRALNSYPPAAVRTAIKEWLATDTKAYNRLPYPGELTSLTQHHARVLQFEERQARTNGHACPLCAGTRWIGAQFEGTDIVKPCPECLPNATRRHAGGHYHPNHDQGACADCEAVRTHRTAGLYRDQETA